MDTAAVPHRPVSVGPLYFGAVHGDVFGAVSKQLDAIGETWTALAAEVGTTRQNLQRACKLQQAVKVETLIEVLDGLAVLGGVSKRKRRTLEAELAAMGLRVESNGSRETRRVLLMAVRVKARRR